MEYPLLRLRDGFDDTSPELRDAVKTLQERLNALGFGLTVDGLFGTDTEVAVELFQKDHGIEQDGVVGPITWAAFDGAEPAHPTTFPENHRGLSAELVEAAKYEAVINLSADAAGVPRAVVLGIGSRESGWGLMLKPPGPAGTGDFASRNFPATQRTGPKPPDGKGFGRGLLQIDYDFHVFARAGAWADPAKNIDYGIKVLVDNRAYLKNRVDLTDAALLQAALAAYNSGAGNVLRAIRANRDVDFYTSGHNYAADVLSRAAWFSIHGWTW